MQYYSTCHQIYIRIKNKVHYNGTDSDYQTYPLSHITCTKPGHLNCKTKNWNIKNHTGVPGSTSFTDAASSLSILPKSFRISKREVRSQGRSPEELGRLASDPASNKSLQISKLSACRGKMLKPSVEQFYSGTKSESWLNLLISTANP